MIGDGFIVVLAVVLAVNGWRRGLINSWRGPLAMVAATLVVQQVYVDFATWIMSRTRLNPEESVFLGYLMLWFSIEAVIEIALAIAVRLGRKQQPLFFDRVGGALYGVLKACVIAVLPLMAVSVPLKIPPPPPQKAELKFNFSLPKTEGGFLAPGFRSVATALVPVIGSLVVSDKAPSFTPTYDEPPKADGEGVESRPTDAGVPKKEIEELLKD